jgi:polysaccharide deacetylase 2 family uncharacterized protein YibQ
MDAELRQPLRRRSWRDRLHVFSPTPLRLATALLLISAFALVIWSSHRYDPALGEPVVHLKIEPLAPVHTASTTPLAPDGEPAGGEIEDGAVDLFSLDESPAEELETTETQTAVIVAPRIRLTPAPAKGYYEAGADGPLPKLSSSGRRPFDIYARPVHKGVLQSSQPKIAILLGGMGINPDLTSRAASELPEEITFAFAPYGNKLQTAINETRGRGHEVMLQLPMEPFGYPDLNPGPHTLLVAADPAAMNASLSWLLSRFAGYTGVVNYLGARFTSETAALSPVMRVLKERGLVYLDDGSSQRSLTGEIAGGVDLPVRRADMIIDGDSSFSAITAKLQELEKLSRDGRIVIGVGSVLPATIEAVEAWSRKLQSRGILLVPVSAAFRTRPG